MNEINEIKWLRVPDRRSQSEFGKPWPEHLSRGGQFANWESGIQEATGNMFVQLIKYYLLHEGLIKYDEF